jgi:hypothetical protein
MTEWPKVPDSKSGVPARVPGVRIHFSPPNDISAPIGRIHEEREKVTPRRGRPQGAEGEGAKGEGGITMDPDVTPRHGEDGTGVAVPSEMPRNRPSHCSRVVGLRHPTDTPAPFSETSAIVPPVQSALTPYQEMPQLAASLEACNRPVRHPESRALASNDRTRSRGSRALGTAITKANQDSEGRPVNGGWLGRGGSRAMGTTRSRTVPTCCERRSRRGSVKPTKEQIVPRATGRR